MTMPELDGRGLEAATRAAYENWIEPVQCAEIPYDKLEESHRDRLRECQSAAIRAYLTATAGDGPSGGQLMQTIMRARDGCTSIHAQDLVEDIANAVAALYARTGVPASSFKAPYPLGGSGLPVRMSETAPEHPSRENGNAGLRASVLEEAAKVAELRADYFEQQSKNARTTEMSRIYMDRHLEAQTISIQIRALASHAQVDSMTISGTESSTITTGDPVAENDAKGVKHE